MAFLAKITVERKLTNIQPNFKEDVTAVEIEPEIEPDNQPEDSEPAEETVEEVEHAEIEHEPEIEAEVAVEEPVELIEPELPPGPKLTNKRPDSVHDTEM